MRGAQLRGDRPFCVVAIGSDNAAMAFYNSSPTISNVTINGQSNSWNGVRFAQGSTGLIQYSTIQNCGAGNGIGFVGECVFADFA